MDAFSGFIHSRVLIKTHGNESFIGILLGFDQYLNSILQNAKKESDPQLISSLLIKGSNIVHITKV